MAREGGKAWIAVVDAGPLYDPMAHALEEGGIPTFRTADRALKLFGRYCVARLAGGPAGRAAPPARPLCYADSATSL
jgi:hypothetical protein